MTNRSPICARFLYAFSCPFLSSTIITLPGPGNQAFEGEPGSVEVHCPEQVLPGLCFKDADTDRLYCLSSQVIFKNIDKEVRLHNNLEIDPIDLRIGVMVTGYETDPVDNGSRDTEIGEDLPGDGWPLDLLVLP
jgi:hypothetical protein